MDHNNERCCDVEAQTLPDWMVRVAWPASMITPHAAVLVENWHHKEHGRVRRAYLAGFTEPERKRLGRLRGKAWKWIMQSGTPDRVTMSVGNYALLVKAASFFATH